MLNKVILIGNLGRDPEIRTTQSGQTKASFTLATNRRWKDKMGNRQDETEWHNIIVWGKQAEIAGQYLKKGKQIYLEGRIQNRSWEDKQSGEKRYITEIVCDNFQMLGQRGDMDMDRGGMSGGPGGGPSYDEGGGSGGYGGGGGGYGGEPEDDDIPF